MEKCDGGETMELACIDDFRNGVTAIFCPTKEDARVLIGILGAYGIGVAQLIDHMFTYDRGHTLSVRCERHTEARVAVIQDLRDRDWHIDNGYTKNVVDLQDALVCAVSIDSIEGFV